MTTDPRIELWDLDDVRPHPQNPKLHSAEQVRTLAGLIERSGWTQPIVVQRSTGLVIAGHGRRLAAIRLRKAGKLRGGRVPVMALDVDDAEAAALRLADNRVASTDYDEGILRSEMAALAGLDVDLGGLGFDAADIAFLEAAGASGGDMGVAEAVAAAPAEADLDAARERAEAAQEVLVPVGLAFGFRKVTRGQAETLKTWMARLEIETGATGVGALMAHLSAAG